jgi:hypothetical protein
MAFVTAITTPFDQIRWEALHCFDNLLSKVEDGALVDSVAIASAEIQAPPSVSGAEAASENACLRDSQCYCTLRGGEFVEIEDGVVDHAAQVS